MRWEDRRRSDNVDDRRGQKSSPINAAMGGGIAMRLLPVLLKTKGGRTLLLLGVLAFFGARMLGIDLMPLLTGEQVSTSSTAASAINPILFMTSSLFMCVLPAPRCCCRTVGG